MRLCDNDLQMILHQLALPLSSILFRGGKHIQPQCPPRLDFQILKTYQWSRCPMTSNKVHVLKLSDIRGWSMLIEDAGDNDDHDNDECDELIMLIVISMITTYE